MEFYLSKIVLKIEISFKMVRENQNLAKIQKIWLKIIVLVENQNFRKFCKKFKFC